MGWVNCFGSNDSQINPHMCAKFGRGPTVESKKGEYRQTHKGTLQLYIVECINSGNGHVIYDHLQAKNSCVSRAFCIECHHQDTSSNQN